MTARQTVWQRARRAEGKVRRDAARSRGERYIVQGITHGIYGYSTYCCDCLVCRVAKSAHATKYRKSRARGRDASPC